LIGVSYDVIKVERAVYPVLQQLTDAAGHVDAAAVKTDSDQ